jgi:hypothetical protein
MDHDGPHGLTRGVQALARASSGREDSSDEGDGVR